MPWLGCHSIPPRLNLPLHQQCFDNAATSKSSLAPLPLYLSEVKPREAGAAGPKPRVVLVLAAPPHSSWAGWHWAGHGPAVPWPCLSPTPRHIPLREELRPWGSPTAHPSSCPAAQLFLPFTWVVPDCCRASGCGRGYSTTLPLEKATASRPSRLICGSCRMNGVTWSHCLRGCMVTIPCPKRQGMSEGTVRNSGGKQRQPPSSRPTFLAVVGGSQAPLGQNFMSQTQPWSAAMA